MAGNARKALRTETSSSQEKVIELASVRAATQAVVHESTSHPAQETSQEDLEHQQRLKNLARPLRKRGLWVVVARRLASLCLMLLVILGAVAGGLYWRLSRGPMSVPFVRDMMRDSIAAKLPPGYRISLEGFSIEHRGSGLTALISGVSIYDNASKLASSPRIAVELNTPALLTGGIAPRSIVIEGAAATVNVSPDGKFTLRPGVQPAPTSDEAALSPVAVMNALDAVIASAGSIDAIELKDATLAIHDQAIGHDVIHRNIDLTIRRTTASGGVSLALAAAGGTINATAAGTGSEPRTIDIHASNISITELASALAPGAEQPAMTASFDVLARARLEPDGSIGMAQASVTSVGGSWNVEPDFDPFVFDKAQLDLHWDKPTGTIQLDQATVTAGEGIIDFKGVIRPPSAATAGLWKFDLAAPNALLAGRRAEQPPLKLDTISVSGHYDPATNRLGLDKGEAVGPTAALVFAGAVNFGGKTPGIDLNLTAKSMSAVALTRLWPVFALPRAKAWLEDHIKGGTVDGATLTLAIPNDALAAVNGKTPPLPDETVRGEVILSNGTVQIVDTLPPISNIEGKATFTGRHLDVNIDSATVETEDGGKLAIRNGSYVIPDFAPNPAHQNVAFAVSGPSRAIAELMTRPPLEKAVEGLDVDPAGVTGTADLKVKLDMPLIDHPRDDEVHYSITGSVNAMSINHISGGKLENGSMKLVIEPGLLLLTGKGVFNGLPANIDLRKAADQDMQMALAVTLDDATRRKKGLDFGDMLSGPIQADIHPVPNAKDPHYDIDLDLTAARIKDLLPGWQKPAGKSAKASFTWDPASSGGGGVVENIVFDSGSISLRGDVSLTAENKLRRAVMSTIRLSPGDDFQGTFEPVANGWKVSLRGDQVDARPLLALMQKKAKLQSAGASIAADIQIDKVLGFNDEALTAFGLTLESKGATIRKLDLKGSSQNGQVTASLIPDGRGEGQIVAQSTDAGAFMRFMDYYTHLSGGELAATVTPVLDNMRGDLVLRSFSVENEPALGQYRTTLKNSGKNSGPAPQNGNSAKFTKLHLAFTRTASRIGILDSVVWGPDVGVTLSGDIDYGADRVNLVGTFVPAYALNNIFGQIPLLGEILGGGQYGGLFAINFKVAGHVAAPVLTVNPLSAIAPGFLRKIFEFQKQKE